MLFLVLFAVIAVPALLRSKQSDQARSTLREIHERLSKGGFQVRDLGDYELVTIGADATFPYDRFFVTDLKSGGRRILRQLAESLKAGALLDSIDQVQVVGHTSAEGGDEHNWRLSSQRAATVALFLIDSTGLPACKITALGRGRLYPLDPFLARRVTAPNPVDRRIELEIRPVVLANAEQEMRRQSCVAKPGQRL
jgi:outer membrane protein OmpA-like peptidoglycan-associated protein